MIRLEHQALCPITGYKITRKPAWNFVDSKVDFKESFTWISDNIFLAQPSGYVTGPLMARLIAHSVRVIAAHKPAEATYIRIEDLEALKGVDGQARRLFTEHLREDPELGALILCNADPLIRLTAKLIQLRDPTRFPILFAQSYQDAVLKAQRLILEGGAAERVSTPLAGELCREDGARVDLVQLEYNLISEARWCGQALLGGGFASFSRIGRSILITRLIGNLTPQSLTTLTNKRDSLLQAQEMSEVGREIVDASDLGLGSLRLLCANYLGGYVEPPLVVIPSKLRRWFLRAVTSKSVPRLMPSFEAALRDTIHGLGQFREELEATVTPSIQKPHWKFEAQGFHLEFELIDRNILHAKTSGFLREEHLEPIFALQRQVALEADFPQGRYFFIGGVAGLESGGGSRKARLAYHQRMVDFYREFPFESYIFYGVDSLLGAAINLARPLVSFPVLVKEDLWEALAWINTRRVGRAYEGIRATNALDGQAEATQEILDYLAQIDWTEPQLFTPMRDPGPLAPVYDALDLIKLDLDDLHQEYIQSINQKRKTQEHLVQAQQAAKMTSFTVDASSGAVAWSQTAGELLGVPGASIFPSLEPLFQVLQDAQKTRPLIEQAVEARKDLNIGLSIIRPDGGERMLQFSGHPVSNGEGSTDYLAILQDQTLQQLLISHLEETKQQAEQAKLAQARFLSVVSHELKTPLHQIMSINQIVQTELAEGEARELLEHQQQSSHQLLDKIEDILRFTAAESSLVKLHPSRVQLREFFIDSVTPLGEQARQKGVYFDFDLSGLTSDLGIFDAEKLREVIRNLLGNAVKFTREGQVTFTVKTITREGKEPALEIIITDSGPGFNVARLEQYFQPFFLGDSSIARRHGGVGLGLPISHRLISLLGGKLLVDSKPGEGTTLSFEVPLRLDNDPIRRA